jgi:hypothetical protein
MIEVKQMVRTLANSSNAETGVSAGAEVDFEVSQYLNSGYELINVISLGDYAVGSEKFARILYVFKKETEISAKSARA